MLNLLRDVLGTWNMQARYKRLMQQRVLELAEATGPHAVSPDEGSWSPLGTSRQLSHAEAGNVRDQARRLAAENPHARNVLRLMEVYVTGPGFEPGVAEKPVPSANRSSAEAVKHSLSPQREPADNADVLIAVETLWNRFLRENCDHFSFREYARRTWRDGECFLRLFADRNGPAVRFLDPESIGETPAYAGSQGVLVDDHDAESPRAYLRINPEEGSLLEQIPAAEILHTRHGVDSNERRGVSWLQPLIDPLNRFDQWLDTELTARRLQASIVLWRKVNGSPLQANSLADSARNMSPAAGTGLPRERYRPGTILTTNTSTELQFLQPQTNFSDAVPLGRTLLLCTAAGAGLPEFMLTSDASNANFSSTMVAEGPAVKLFQAEQQFFAREFEKLWRWVLQVHADRGDLPTDVLERVEPRWTFPQLISRDRNRDRLADARLAEAKVLSRAEVARRDNTDPWTMQQEIAAEQTS